MPTRPTLPSPRALVVAALLLPLPLPLPLSLAAQPPASGSVAGVVRVEGRPLPEAQVVVLGARRGAVTDAAGAYRLAGLPPGRHTLRVRRLGHAPAERAVEVVAGAERRLDVELAPASGMLQAVVTTGTLRERYVAASPVKVEVVTERFLQRNVASSLMDNIRFVNGLAQQVDCGVCFTSNIRINGMEGPYTAVLIDGTPVMSALASVYGLDGINPALIQQVEVIRGPASTLYGTEAMGGVVNIITKDPRFAPRWSLNAFGTTHGETNLDFAAAPRVGGAHTLLSGTVAYNDRFVDRNGDGFTDLPLNRRLALFNKWSVGSAEARRLDVSAKYYHEDRFGGQRGWTRADRGGTRVYGESILTRRGELVGAWRPPLDGDRARLAFSANRHDQDSFYGTQRFRARQGVAFAQLTWEHDVGDRHQALFGGSLRYQTYDDDTPATARAERRVIPGLLAQDEVALTPRLTALGGLRLDHHADHGVIPAPRLALRWQPGEATTLRLNTATGFRVVNLFTEDHAAVTGAREVVIAERLEPERSVNATLGLEHHVHLAGGDEELLVFGADLFLTRFTNKIQPDYNSDPDRIVYANLDGAAVTRGLSVSAQLSAPARPYTFSLGATLQDVWVERDGARQALEFAPRVQGVATASYTVRRAGGLTLDYTGRVVGPMPLPIFPGLAARSPWFGEHHLQLTGTVGDGLQLYAALKNVLDHRQGDPLVDPHDPFGSTFDTFRVYGPLQGRRLLVGTRWAAGR